MSLALGQGTGPLRGVRVVELAGIGPGPHACMILADLGADVIRVDRPGGQPLTGGPPRPAQPRPPERRPRPQASGRHRDGARPGRDAPTCSSKGSAPAPPSGSDSVRTECLARNPRLVYGRMTGWGQDGPLAPTAGHDLGYIAITGALFGMGQDPGRPMFPSNLVGDFGGGSTYLVIGILAALLEARLSGEGQVVDAAIVDGTAHLNAMATGFLAERPLPRAARGEPPRRGRRRSTTSTRPPTGDTSRSAPSSRSSTTSSCVASASPTPSPDRNDPAQHAELRRVLGETIRQRTQAEWTEVFAGSDACVAPVLPMSEAFEHPHLDARGTFVERDGDDPAGSGAALLPDLAHP